MGADFLMVSDVDGTLLGDEAAVRRFAKWIADHRDRFRVVYNSGRFTDSVRRSIEKFGLPEPDALIGGVGTQIEDFASGQPIGDWPRLNGTWDAPSVQGALAGNPRLVMQPERFLSEYKVSYYAENASHEELRHWHELLTATGLAVSYIYSSKRDLDFLPEGCNKGSATAYLTQVWGYTPERVIVCGDTDNDRGLYSHGFMGIVVANALDELRSLASPCIYHAKASFAAGVVEGLEYWLRKIENAQTVSKVGDAVGIDV